MYRLHIIFPDEKYSLTLTVLSMDILNILKQYFKSSIRDKKFILFSQRLDIKSQNFYGFGEPYYVNNIIKLIPQEHFVFTTITIANLTLKLSFGSLVDLNILKICIETSTELFINGKLIQDFSL